MNEYLSSLAHFRQLMETQTLLSLGLLLAAGYILGKLLERIRIPAITGYIMAGLIMGRSISGIITPEMSESLNILTEIALGIIALTIGAEFSFDKVKRTGAGVIIITLFEALFAFLFVTFFLSITGFGLYYALLLGAIAAATAPASTVIIVRELRARGEFIDYLYGVVAFDDAVCVLLFSVVFSVAAPYLAGIDTGAGVLAGISHAVVEIFLSVFLGCAGGFILHLTTKKKYRTNEILLIALSALFLVIAFSMAFRLSLLIANMVMGSTLVNLSSRNRRIFDILEPVTPPLFALLFIIAGTGLDVSVFTGGTAILYGMLYLVSRFMGKYTGVYSGALIARAPVKIRRYLGLCLFPQEGVALGLALLIQTSPLLQLGGPTVQNTITIIINIILMNVFINALIGPLLTRSVLLKGVDTERR
jgi:Kef-type K+ transport system membrane component KefB